MFHLGPNTRLELFGFGGHGVGMVFNVRRFALGRAYGDLPGNAWICARIPIHRRQFWRYSRSGLRPGGASRGLDVPRPEDCGEKAGVAGTTLTPSTLRPEWSLHAKGLCLPSVSQVSLMQGKAACAADSESTFNLKVSLFSHGGRSNYTGHGSGQGGLEPSNPCHTCVARLNFRSVF